MNKPTIFFLVALFWAAQAYSETQNLNIKVQGGGLSIAPKQVIFTPNSKKVATLLLSNSSNQVNTYRIRLIHYQMQKDGNFKDIDLKEHPLPYTLNRKVRFSPRQITIAPKSTQVVKVMIRGVKNLQGHEYRSRIKFITIPALKKNEPNLEDGKIGFNLIGLFGISVPVIYWPEGTHSELQIKNLTAKVQPDGLHIKFTAIRTGNASNFSDLTFYLNKNGIKTKIYQIKRHFIYYPATEVEREYIVKDFPEKTLGGTIEVDIQPATL